LPVDSVLHSKEGNKKDYLCFCNCCGSGFPESVLAVFLTHTKINLGQIQKYLFGISCDHVFKSSSLWMNFGA
jgi:hypothetical protein